jgi:hypothetical protein
MSDVVVSLETLASHLCELYGINDPLYKETVAISDAYLKRANAFTASGKHKKTTGNSLCAHPTHCCGCTKPLGEIQGFCVSPGCDYQMKPQPCFKCSGQMNKGVAIMNTFTAGMPDFPGSKDDRCVTMSIGGPGKMIDCWKCENCGRSITYSPAYNENSGD